MHHQVALVATVAISFVLAAVFGYLADRLRLPALVGYLVAGIVIGPFTFGYAADSALASQLAEIGVILLMFGVGLHFSTSDLMAVRGVALPGAVFQIVLATLLGIGLCHLWGWKPEAGLVFGLSLSIASTVVLLKALGERNLIASANGRVAMGWLIVEDLAMVLALVLLPSIASLSGGGAASAAAHGPAAGGVWQVAIAIALTLVKVGGFALLAVALGPRLVPQLLTLVARTGSRELFTLTVLAIALGIAFGSAIVFGVSFALGAFFAGVVMSESHLSHRAAADSLPLQNAFSVLFFVSVGMLFDPSILIREPIAVVAVLALITCGKSLIALCLVLLLRYPLGMGLTVAAGLGQIGEFSFVLAGLGISLGILPQEGYDLILGGAILSIALNPLLFEIAEWAKKKIRSRWPSSMRLGATNLAALQQRLEVINARNEEREERQQLKKQQLVKTFPLFSGIDDHALDQLLLLFQPMSASPGDRIVRVGERGDAMYFVASGAVEVLLEKGTIRLEAGSFFGEMALLTGTPRTADVVAIDFCQLLRLDRRDFNIFMSHHPRLRAVVSDMARDRRQMNR
ncbi:cation:proton antiporter [Sinorhizobium sp. BG8]|uniref:cation:proton antiporter domain-containing protein n=1 Tax=Sinorhizobium sp. BG8 TaxID=2613773 RepID=UPI00193E559F|nr:cation:proton antiporter [Sinorhizobium sp. BG8]QRM57522.1 cyclic nucleotide-binding domain-containing protein [Sinorhizobium sp. BG8]